MLCVGLTNARFLAMDPDHPVAHDLGIWRGRILGLDEAVTSLPAREVVDLQRATVLPGFMVERATGSGQVIGPDEGVVDDPRRVDTSRIGDIEVVATYVDGGEAAVQQDSPRLDLKVR